MNLFKNSTQNQFKSALVRRLFPMITLSVLGLTSGSLGYYIAQNPSLITRKGFFFEDSKANAAPPLKEAGKLGLKGVSWFKKAIGGAGSVDELADAWKLGKDTTKGWVSKADNLQPIARGTKAVSNISAFQAIPLPNAKQLKLYKTPYRNPSSADTEILSLSNAQSFLPLKVTKDPKTNWLTTTINGNDYYIDPLDVLCNADAVCLENADTFARNPYILETLETKRAQLLSMVQGKLW